MIDPDLVLRYTTFQDFCSRVRAVAFPDGVGETNIRAHTTFIKNALIKAQRYIPCMRKIQVSFYYKPQVYDHCGISTFQGPRGRINAVYAFKPNDPDAAAGSEDDDALCRKFFYKAVSPQFVTNWSRLSACRWKDPSTVDYKPGLDTCYPYDEDAEDPEEDCNWKIEEKYYARGQVGQIFLAPRFPCGYIVAIHWEGLRRTWEDTDAVPDDEDLIDWAASYMSVEHALRIDHEAAGLHDRMAMLERTKFADLMYWCNEERRMAAKLDATQGIDTGNLFEMFQSIYPYGEFDQIDIGGGDGGDGGGEEPGGSLPPLAGNEMLILESTDFSGQADQTEISTWTDQSPYANDFEQAVAANRPWVDQFYKLNGNPTVRFQENPASTIRYLARSTWDATHQDAGYSFDEAEIIVIMRRDEDPPTDVNQIGAPFKFGNSSGNNSHVPLNVTGDVYENFGQATRPNSGDPTTAFTDWIVYQIKIQKVNTTQCARTIYVGSEVLENDAGSGVYASPKPGSGLSLGASFQGLFTVDQSMQGNIAAIYLFDAQMSAPQRALWTTYIQNKWGLTIN